MTLKEFNDLRLGDNVKLPFSINESQIVTGIDRMKCLVMTQPVDDNGITYTIDYGCIEFVSHAVQAYSKEKEQILAWFDSFKCDTCPFADECSNTYDEIRAHTSNAFTLCDALRKKAVNL